MKWMYAYKLGLIRLAEGGEGEGGSGGEGGGPQGGTEPEGGEGGQEPKAPWTEDNFDASRAARLLQNKEADLAKTRQQLEALQKQVDEAENAKLTEQQRIEKERDEAKASGSSLALENARLKAAITHGLTEEDLEFIGGATPEEIAEKAKKYAERHGTDAKGGQGLSIRPKPRLGGGSDPSVEPDEMDPTKLAAQIPRR